MIIDGDRLKYLFSKATNRVIVCAPFIKKGILSELLSVVDESVHVDVYTRWHLKEIALGVSDLEVFDLLQEREHGKLYLIQNLHAKLYASDETFIVGSANVTGSALGWSSNPNVEVLVPAPPSDPGLFSLLCNIKTAEEVVENKKNELMTELEELEPPAPFFLDEGEGPSSSEKERRQYWMPACSIPKILWSIYIGNDLSGRYTSGAIEDALSDLKVIGPPDGLDQVEFSEYVANFLKLSPVFSEFIEEIPKRLSEEKAFDIFSGFFSNVKEDEKKVLWDIVTQWISVFFSSEYEVAPTKFEVRLR